MPLPNLLLAGSPKCGTTSVYDWLVRHPEVSGGVEKELFYLIDPSDWQFDARRNWRDHGEKGYAELLRGAGPWFVDGTTLTMYQDAALEYAASRKPRAVFFLREPAARVYSTFKYFRDSRTRLPRQMTFREYLDRVEAGEEFDGINQLADAVVQSRYHESLEKWRDIVGAERIRIYIFETAIRSPGATMEDLSRWLGIDDAFYADFDFAKKNETVLIKSRRLNRIKETVAPLIKSKALKDALRPVYYSLNARKASRAEVQSDKGIVRELKGVFTESNDRLREQFGVDLGPWES